MIRKLKEKWQEQNLSLNKTLGFDRRYTDQICDRDYKLFYMCAYIICKHILLYITFHGIGNHSYIKQNNNKK